MLAEQAIITMHKYEQGGILPAEIEVSAEYPVTIRINGQHLATIACSGSSLEDMAAGHLLSEGIISSARDIAEIYADESNLMVDVRLLRTLADFSASYVQKISASGHRGRRELPTEKFVHEKLPEVKADIITRSMKRFLSSSPMRERTYGVHSGALATIYGEMLAFYDDIGRHNAIDKLLGFSIRNSIDLSDKMILSTGRISGEIAVKIITSRAPVFISRASPTDYSAELIKKYNVLGICRARDDSFMVINGYENVKVPSAETAIM